MEYLKPIETLQASLKKSKTTIYLLFALLAFVIGQGQFLLRDGPYIINQKDSLYSVSRAEPWKISETLIERFLNQYLDDRYAWAPENFRSQLSNLKELTDEGIYKKLKDGSSSFQSFAENDHGHSFYVLEGFCFSNKDRKIEAKVIRILKIKDAATAIPINLKLSYQNAAITEKNPYGLVVTSFEESVPVDTKNQEGK